MRPRRRRIMLLLARRTHLKAPPRLTDRTLSNSASVIRMSSWSRVMPAFATSTSTGPFCASIVLNASSTVSVFVTSPTIPRMPSAGSWPLW